MSRILNILAERLSGAGGVAVGVAALLSGAVVAGAVAAAGFAAIVVSTGDLIERSLGLEWGARSVGEGSYEALGMSVRLETWELPIGGPEVSGTFGRPVQAQVLSTASDTGKRFYSGDDDTYRTVCVRLCDGYYWTISFSTTDEHFGRDQGRCEASCGVPARLYKYRNPGSRPEEMEDLDGQPYTKLKTAFQFRTRFDAACRCQANPWDKDARAQHRLYEIAAAKAQLEPAQKAEIEVLKQVVAEGASARMTRGTAAIAAWAKVAPKKATRTASASTSQRRTKEAARRVGASKDPEASEAAGSEAPGAVIAAAAKSGTGMPSLAVMRLGGPAPRPQPTHSASRLSGRPSGDWRQKVFSGLNNQ